MLEVNLLGRFEVFSDGKRLSIPTRNAQSLFAYLLLNAGVAHRRERLAGLLWPDSSEDNARSNLRHELWRLRKALKPAGDAYLLSDDLTIAFNRESDYALDVHILENKPLEGSAVEELVAALSAYHGELLPGFYDEWVLMERDRLHGLFEARMARLMEALEAEGRWPEILDWGMRWIALGQWPEPAYRSLMTAYASSGDVSKAMATYERFSQGLYNDLGVAPSEQTQALYRRLKSGWKSENKATPVRPAEPTAQPSARQPTAGPLLRARRSNLPNPMTSFIGREKEIQQVQELVRKARLVTIAGTGGVGKTRLAIEAARPMVERFRDGVRWVELAALSVITAAKQKGSNAQPGKQTGFSGADSVAQEVAKALRIPETPGLPLVDGVVEYLYDQQLLLALDNCEHLIEACAALVERLLSACPEVSILATSREPLGISGEKAWYLPSLSLPAAERSSASAELVQSEAVGLFIERTKDILPGYQPGETEAAAIEQICLRLDGIPLAIELAAARMNLLSAREIAARLDSRFSLLTAGRRTVEPRHQALLAAIEWSYDLLEDAEVSLFRRLSIFAGSFTLDAAEAVCTDETIKGEDVLTLLGRLVDKSLLSVDPGLQDPELSTRYRLLDTIRSFGRLKLEEAGETRLLRDRLAEYYIALVEAAEPELLLSDQGRWYRLLQAEYDNIRAVVEWSVESNQAGSALRLVGAMLWFWWSHGSIQEGNALVKKALSLPTADQFQTYRARALNTAVYLHWVLGENDIDSLLAISQKIEEALAILRTSDDEANLAWSLQFLGLVLTSAGKYEQADVAMQEGTAIARKLGDLNKSSFSLAFHGDIALQQGDLARAERIYKESTDVLRSIGNILFTAYPLRRLGYLALMRNEISYVLENFKESLAINVEGGDHRGVAACLTGFAALALHLEKPALAARLLGAVDNQLESRAHNLLHLDQTELERVRSQLRACLDQATFAAALAEGWNLTEDQAINLLGEVWEERNLVMR